MLIFSCSFFSAVLQRCAVGFLFVQSKRQQIELAGFLTDGKLGFEYSLLAIGRNASKQEASKFTKSMNG